MRTQKNRIRKLEQKVPPLECKFVGWIGNPWTPEQEAEAIRRSPTKRFFYRSLLETTEDTKKKMADPSAEL